MHAPAFGAFSAVVVDDNVVVRGRRERAMARGAGVDGLVLPGGDREAVAAMAAQAGFECFLRGGHPRPSLTALPLAGEASMPVSSTPPGCARAGCQAGRLGLVHGAAARWLGGWRRGDGRGSLRRVLRRLRIACLIGGGDHESWRALS